MATKRRLLLASGHELKALIKGGMSLEQVATRFGVTKSAICVRIKRDGLEAAQRIRVVNVAPALVASAAALPTKADQMKWVTEEGAIVTLPRISFIVCPRAFHSEPVMVRSGTMVSKARQAADGARKEARGAQMALRPRGGFPTMITPKFYEPRSRAGKRMFAERRLKEALKEAAE